MVISKTYTELSAMEWLWVIGVLRHFQQSFSHITTVAACCMRRDSARVLSPANTDATCCRHKTRVPHPVTLSWHRVNQSWLYPLNAERLARKQLHVVPMLTPLVWRGRGPNPRPTDYEANAISTRPGSRSFFNRSAPICRFIGEHLTSLFLFYSISYIWLWICTFAYLLHTSVCYFCYAYTNLVRL